MSVRPVIDVGEKGAETAGGEQGAARPSASL
jgi:hypothetical protein